MRVRPLQILGDCLPGLTMFFSVVMLAVAIWQVSDAVDRSRDVHVLRESIVASMAAEEAAFLAAEEAEAGPGRLHMESRAGMLCSVRLRKSHDGPVIEIDVRGGGERYYSYECRLLPGGSPRALGWRLAARASILQTRPKLNAWLRSQSGDALQVLSAEDYPVLAADVKASPNPTHLPDFVTDESLALLRLSNGTDLADYRFDQSKDGCCRPSVPTSGVIVLPGHLWVDRGPSPLVLHLKRHVTIVARGNLYIGRNIEVRGAGRLTLVAARSSEASQPMEQTGQTHLGLAGRTTEIVVQANVVSDDDVALNGRITVCGALVLGAGLRRAEESWLCLPGTHRIHTGRDRVPGFRSQGAPRPGFLTPAR